MAERRGVKREFVEMPLAYDPEEIMRYMKALVRDQPKILVDLGGIPDQLGIEGCISLRVPSLTLKVPRHLQDPTLYYKVLRTVLKKSLERDNYKNLVEQCYEKMFGPSCSFNQTLVTTRHLLEAIDNKLEEKPLDDAANLVHPDQAEMAENRGIRCIYSQGPLEEVHGYNFHEFMFYMNALMRAQPAILALLGGVPDMLQIKDCLSYRVPSPTIKVPCMVLHNPTEYYKALRGVIEKSLAENDVESKVDQKAAFGISPEPHNIAPIHDLLQVISQQLGEERANIDASLASLHLNPKMKQPARSGTVGSKYTKYSYNDPCYAPIEIIRHEFGVDSVEIIYSKGVLVNEPGVVFAIGGIPEKMKIKGAKSFSFPCPIFKFPRKVPADPILRGKIMAIAYNGAVERFGSRKLFLQAYKEAMGVGLIPEPPEEEEKVKFRTHNMHCVPCPIIEVNLAGPLKKIPRQLWWMFINGAGEADPKSYNLSSGGSLLMEPINGAGQGELESYNLLSGGSLLMEPINGSWAGVTET